MATSTNETVLADLSNEEYQQHPALSNSRAHTLLKAPAILKYERENGGRKSTKTFDRGSLAHAMVLRDDSVEIVTVDATDWRTKAAREARDEARERGAIPALVHEVEAARAMVDVVQAHAVAGPLLALPGRSEVSLFWTDEETGLDLRCRVDRLPDPIEGKPYAVLDYKTAKSSEPGAFARSAAEYGYYMQAPWYLAGVRANGIHPDPAFVFIVQETEPPYLVTVQQLDDEAMALGERRMREAIATYIECETTGVWPGYLDDDIARVSLPAWFTRKHEEELTA